jgi:hypothetical protein
MAVQRVRIFEGLPANKKTEVWPNQVVVQFEASSSEFSL